MGAKTTETPEPQMQIGPQPVEELNRLVTLCHDAEEGYKKAQDAVDNANLQQMFHDLAQERARFITQLSNKITDWNGEPTTSGSLPGALHRGWMDLATIIADREAVAILQECTRGEEFAKEAYQNVLADTDLDDSTRQLITAQYNEIDAAYRRMQELQAEYE